MNFLAAAAFLALVKGTSSVDEVLIVPVPTGSLSAASFKDQHDRADGEELYAPSKSFVTKVYLRGVGTEDTTEVDPSYEPDVGVLAAVAFHEPDAVSSIHEGVEKKVSLTMKVDVLGQEHADTSFVNDGDGIASFYCKRGFCFSHHNHHNYYKNCCSNHDHVQSCCAGYHCVFNHHHYVYYCQH